MKEWNVEYSYELFVEATIKAKSKKEAEKKIKEVVGKEVKIAGTWEVKKY